MIVFLWAKNSSRVQLDISRVFHSAVFSCWLGEAGRSKKASLVNWAPWCFFRVASFHVVPWASPELSEVLRAGWLPMGTVQAYESRIYISLKAKPWVLHTITSTVFYWAKEPRVIWNARGEIDSTSWWEGSLKTLQPFLIFPKKRLVRKLLP